MKKEVILSLFLISMMSLVSATCNLDVTMINQDPYPAVPGDYVKLVFQIDGTENPECDQVYLELVEDYPIIFDPNTSNSIMISGGTFVKDYNSHLMAPFKVRVDEEALDGDNPITVKYTSDKPDTTYRSKDFNLNVDNVKADFEIFVSDYEKPTNTLTLEVLNIEEADVEALTIEIPKQEQIQVKGAFRNVVGDLDSNEFTSTDFEASPKDGEFQVNIYYTDEINVRRVIEKQVTFDSSYFEDRASDQNGLSTSTYIVILLIIVIVIWYFYKRHKKKKSQKHKH